LKLQGVSILALSAYIAGICGNPAFPEMPGVPSIAWAFPEMPR